MKPVSVASYSIGAPSSPLTLIAGPCVIEDRDSLMTVAEKLAELKERYPLQIFFKSSYDKANRNSVHSYRGPGIQEGLKLLQEVRNQFGLPIFTDVHSPDQAKMAGEVVDMIQIPAFLCRQTDLLVAAGETGRAINIKKGQFLSASEMGNAVEKVRSTGNESIVLTERGTFFGYQNLVSDFRNIPLMQDLGFPVLFDATHSVQLPGALGNQTGGQRRFIPFLSKAALAVGAQGIYAETHPNPPQAKCDAACQLPLSQIQECVQSWLNFYECARKERTTYALA